MNIIFEESWIILNNLENKNISLFNSIIILLILVRENSKVLTII
jgi:hypothetical protein